MMTAKEKATQKEAAELKKTAAGYQTDLVMRIPMSQIRAPAGALRLSADTNHIEELSASMKSLGLLHPIIVKKNGDGYEIIAGHRRYLAAQKLEWKNISCMVSKNDDTKNTEIMLAENLARENLSPIETGSTLERMRSELGYSMSDLVEKLGRSEDWIRARISLIDYPPDLQEALHYGKIKMAVAKALVDLPHDDTRNIYLTEAIERGASAKVVKMWVEMWKDANNANETVRTPRIPEALAETPKESVRYCAMCAKVWRLLDLKAVFLCPSCYQVVLETRKEIEHGSMGSNSGDSAHDSDVGQDGTQNHTDRDKGRDFV
jgi:ParB/RepB/Spo0J family partition protein